MGTRVTSPGVTACVCRYHLGTQLAQVAGEQSELKARQLVAIRHKRVGQAGRLEQDLAALNEEHAQALASRQQLQTTLDDLCRQAGPILSVSTTPSEPAAVRTRLSSLRRGPFFRVCVPRPCRTCV